MNSFVTINRHPGPNAVHAQRCLTHQQVRVYVGLSDSGLADWIDRELIPGPIKGTKRWDRKAIDLALDKASGIAATSEPSAYDKWKAGQGAGAS